MKEITEIKKSSSSLGRISRVATLFGLIVFSASTLRADQISVPNQFQTGGTARAAEVNANFDALVTESNAQDLRLESLETDVSDTASQLDTTDARVTALEAGAVTYNRVESPVTNIAAGSALRVDVTCPSGLAISGGVVSISRFTVMTASYADITMNTWSVRVDNPSASSRSFTAFAICAE